MRDNLPDLEVINTDNLEESKDATFKEVNALFDLNEIRGEGDKRLLRRVAKECFGLSWGS